MLNLKNNSNFFINTCEIQLKIKSFSSLHWLKLAVYFKKINNYLIFNFIALPAKLKQIVILRSPFIYKSSRLKFTFEILAGLISLKLRLTNKKLKFLIVFLLKKLSKTSFFDIYFLKKITTGFYF